MKRQTLLLSLLAVLLLASCASRKNFVYLQDMQVGEGYRVGNDGDIDASAISSGPREKGYRVDVDGNIDFPILGKLHVEGLKVSEVTNLIRERIIAGNYIKDPIVSLEFLNFKYTVLGAVANNGTFTVDGDRITLIDAIARAGDLNAKARIDRVAVIREIGGERKMFMHDLRSMDIFESPCYYLQQNDIVYVEPKYRKKDNEDRTVAGRSERLCFRS